MAAPLHEPRRSAIAIAKEIMRVDGPRGFVRGLAPVLIRAFPVNASALFVYEGTMRMLGAEKVRHRAF
jgi:solute carrier family 25 carnitine/acylcarnitine transporter 20/29